MYTEYESIQHIPYCVSAVLLSWSRRPACKFLFLFFSTFHAHLTFSVPLLILLRVSVSLFCCLLWPVASPSRSHNYYSPQSDYYLFASFDSCSIPSFRCFPLPVDPISLCYTVPDHFFSTLLTCFFLSLSLSLSLSLASTVVSISVSLFSTSLLSCVIFLSLPFVLPPLESDAHASSVQNQTTRRMMHANGFNK